MLKDSERLTRILIQARQLIADTVAETGGCDHSTGICCCADVRLIDDIDAALFEAHGLEMIWRFFYAEPTQTPDERRKWKASAQRAIERMAFIKAGEVDEHIDGIERLR